MQICKPVAILSVIAPLTLILALALPHLRLLFLTIGLLLGFWLSRTSINSREYDRRYIREELSEGDDSDG